MITKVFLSHQKKDRDEVVKIAEYFTDLGIEIFFDEYDQGLLNAQDNPQKIVNAIKKGINNSTHMLCVISKNTLLSKWVPFEVGYGFDKTEVAVLTLKGIRKSELPDYIKVVKTIRDIYDLNKFIKDKSPLSLITENKNFYEFSASSHPLSNIMDKIIQN